MKQLVLQFGSRWVSQAPIEPTAELQERLAALMADAILDVADAVLEQREEDERTDEDE